MPSWRPWLSALLALVLHLPAAASPACAGSAAVPSGVRLNEILAGPARDWDGSGVFSSRDDEWIEIANAGSATVDLSGFFLTDGDSIPRFALSGTLAPGELRVVTGKASYDWEKLVGQPAFGLSLGNAGDSAMLWAVSGADTVLVDSYTYKSHEAAADRSIGRAVDGGQWQLFDGLDPYTGTLTPAGNGCGPTPGLPNACAPAPTHGQTWGAIKAAYR